MSWIQNQSPLICVKFLFCVHHWTVTGCSPWEWAYGDHWNKFFQLSQTSIQWTCGEGVRARSIIMLVVYLFGFLLAQNVDSGASNRGPPSRPTSTLVQGDKNSQRSSQSPRTCGCKGSCTFGLRRKNVRVSLSHSSPTSKWTTITEAHKQIMEAVPCIRFR